MSFKMMSSSIILPLKNDRKFEWGIVGLIMNAQSFVQYEDLGRKVLCQDSMRLSEQLVSCKIRMSSFFCCRIRNFSWDLGDFNPTTLRVPIV